MHRAHRNIVKADDSLVRDLQRPDAFPEPTGKVDLIETHISWVLLTDEFAYKIKKPVVLDFLDFSTLERRRHFCEEELRLNKPSAPDLYLAVVAICLENGKPRIGIDGTPVEYALKMRRFDQQLRLDRQLAGGLLNARDMRELGQVIAARHQQAAVIPAHERANQIATTKRFIRDNFIALEGHLESERLGALADWSEKVLLEADAILGERFDTGFVRDCHGDLHLSNLVRLPGGITTFDCIEFDSALREIDVICDIAFLVMDLVSRERHDLAAHFLNRYLECTGDYPGVSLLDLFFVYRCLVLAKVAAISAAEHEAGPQRDAALADLDQYCRMAERQSGKAEGMLIVMSGLSGSGKTHLSEQLMAAMPAIRLRSDIERKRLFGLEERSRTHSAIEGGIYTAEANEQVYARLFECAEAALSHGHNVILDAAFLAAETRSAARALARRFARDVVIVRVEAPERLLRERLRARMASAEDASEAGLAVLEHQLQSAEPLSADELSLSVICDTERSIEIEHLLESIRARAQSAPGECQWD